MTLPQQIASRTQSLFLLGLVIIASGAGAAIWFLLDLLEFPIGATIRPMVQVGRSVLSALVAIAAGLILTTVIVVKAPRSRSAWTMAVLLALLCMLPLYIRQQAEDRIVAGHMLTLAP